MASNVALGLGRPGCVRAHRMISWVLFALVVTVSPVLLAQDCDDDGVSDQAEIAAGAPDCNDNRIPDECDLSLPLPCFGPSIDLPGNSNSGAWERFTWNGEPRLVISLVGATSGLGVYKPVDGQWQEASTFALAGAPPFGFVALRSGDLDGDGNPEILAVVVNDGRVRVLRSTDGDRLTVAAVLPIEQVFTPGLSVADFNGDGVADIFVAGRTNQAALVTLLLGNGDFSYTAANIDLQRPVTQLSVSRVADVDGDGDDDMMIASRSPAEMRFYLNRGDATFVLHPWRWQGTFGFWDYADADGDGDMDICGHTGGPNILFLRNDGDTFRQLSAVTSGPINWVTAGDLNGDGVRQFILSEGDTQCYRSSTYLTPKLIGNDVRIDATACDPAETLPQPTFGDLDGDGDADAFGVDWNTGRVGVAYQVQEVLDGDCDGDGVLDSCELEGNDCDLDGIPDDCELTEADCNGNGVPDSCDRDCDRDGIPDDCALASGDDTDCDENGLPDSCEFEHGDLDDDGVLDVCQIAAGEALDCNGNGVPDHIDLTPAVELSGVTTERLDARPGGIAEGDFDGDGDLDVVVALRGECCSATPGTLAFYRSERGRLVDAGTLDIAKDAFAVHAVDLDDDGDLDLVVGTGGHPACEDGHVLRTLLNDGAATFTEHAARTSDGVIVDICSGDFDGDGAIDLGTVSGGLTEPRLFPGDGVGGLVRAVILPTTMNAMIACRALDVDLDGDLDLAISGNSIDLMILRNNGELRFELLPRDQARNVASGMDVADFDLDGRLDVVTFGPIRGDTSTVTVYWNRVDGLFGEPTVLSVPFYAGPLVADDLDRDGWPDIAASGTVFTPYSSSGESYTVVAIIDNVHNRSFSAPALYDVGRGRPSGIVAADLDGDEDREVVAALGEFERSIDNDDFPELRDDLRPTAGALKVVQTRRFEQPVQIQVLPRWFFVTAMVVNDFDGDGNVDVFAAQRWDNLAALMTGSGDGNFVVERQDIVVPPEVFAAATGDLNMDGAADVVLAGSFGIGVLLAQGPAQFVDVRLDENFSSATEVALGDINGDRRLDIVAAAGPEVQIGLGKGNGEFDVGVTLASGATSLALVLADVNDDSALDVIVSNAQGLFDNISVFLGRGDGRFFPVRNFITSEGARGLAAGDVNSDGHIDIVTTGLELSEVLVLVGDGSGRFTDTVRVPAVVPETVELADLDRDGTLDIVTQGELGVFALLGDVDGNFEVSEWPSEIPGNRLLPVDVDNDGHMEVIAGMQGEDHDGFAVLRSSASIHQDRDGDGVPDECSAPPVFRRGDADLDGNRNVSDAIASLQWLFSGGAPLECLDAADADDNGIVNLTDPLRLLGFLFSGGDPLPPPLTECGPDTTADNLGCDRQPKC